MYVCMYGVWMMTLLLCVWQVYVVPAGYFEASSTEVEVKAVDMAELD